MLVPTELIPSSHLFYNAYSVDTKSNVFFTSDAHFNHDKDFIYAKRSYGDVNSMTNTQIKNWNSVISNDDTVFYLGDFKFGQNVSFVEILRRLNFKRIYLMSGNHYSGFQELVITAGGASGLLLDGTKEIQLIPNYFEIWYQKQFIVLCHYPIGRWNKIHRGAWNLFGHCHGTYKNAGGKQLDVGFDNFPMPQSFGQIQRILNKKETITSEIAQSSKFFEYS